mmetsp:Transcript_3535/g.14150  ORF Transcript_3535/g.14150 Transcript_3535/m.14150 type:complete len:380 (+) Transcript_3535:88-1227(+)
MGNLLLNRGGRRRAGRGDGRGVCVDRRRGWRWRSWGRRRGSWGSLGLLPLLSEHPPYLGQPPLPMRHPVRVIVFDMSRVRDAGHHAVVGRHVRSLCVLQRLQPSGHSGPDPVNLLPHLLHSLARLSLTRPRTQRDDDHARSDSLRASPWLTHCIPETVPHGDKFRLCLTRRRLDRVQKFVSRFREILERLHGRLPREETVRLFVVRLVPPRPTLLHGGGNGPLNLEPTSARCFGRGGPPRAKLPSAQAGEYAVGFSLLAVRPGRRQLHDVHVDTARVLLAHLFRVSLEPRVVEPPAKDVEEAGKCDGYAHETYPRGENLAALTRGELPLSPRLEATVPVHLQVQWHHPAHPRVVGVLVLGQGGLELEHEFGVEKLAAPA